MPDEGRDAVCRKARGICVVKLYELPTTFQMWSFFIFTTGVLLWQHGIFLMQNAADQHAKK